MSSYYEKMLATGEVKCIDEEIPFEIPKGWEWCRLGELISYQNGYAYTSSELNKEGKGLPVIKSGNLMTYEVVLKPNNDYVENPSTKMLASAIKKGDLLMCLSSQSDNPEPLGKTAIYNVNNTALLNQRVLKMRPWLEDMLEYMYYAINSEYFHYTVSHQGGGSAQANLKLGHVLSMLIPLAPLKEEIRIVDKINTIMPLIHQYETTFLKQKKLNSELNDRLKSAILQEAIQGKLVPQINEEGTAQELLEQIKAEKQKLVKEGKLKKSTLNDSVIFRGDDNKYWEKKGTTCECIDEDIPFDVPKSWAWVRLETILNTGSARRVHAKDWRQAGIPFYRAREIGKLADDGFVDNELYIDLSLYEDFSSSGVPLPNDLMITAVGTLGKVYIVKGNDKFYYKDGSVLCLANKYGLCAEFLKMVIESPSFKGQYRQESQGTTVATLTMVRLQKYFIPLPPLQEQYRIVEMYRNIASIMSK